jgi:MoaA/NifB/PqqE/SkfB family radical SAM enzyme
MDESVRPATASEKRKGLLRLVIEDGGPGFCQFAITTACNAQCGFCGFARDQRPGEGRRHVGLEGALDAIRILCRGGVRYLEIDGGEPLLHPSVEEIVRHASALKMNVLLVTNGFLLLEERIHALARAGVKGFIISIDAASAETHEGNRGLPGLCDRIRAANQVLSKLRIPSTASTTISRLVDFDALPDFLSTLHFPSVTFSYPLRNLRSNYLGLSQSDLIRFETEELLAVLEKIKQLKKRFPVVNPKASLDEMKRFLRGEEQRYPCLAGYKYFYLDWNLDLWRCYNWPTPMCPIFQFDGSQRIRDGCTECMIDCFRDSSVLHHIGISFSDACQAFRRGHAGAALKAIFRKGNLGSVRSVLEDLRWILRL